jgi:SIR2-like domain
MAPEPCGADLRVQRRVAEGAAYSSQWCGMLTDQEWRGLLSEIPQGNCTPFLGAGACFGTLPLASEVALKWAAAHRFPFDEGRDDLARVAQYLAVTSGNAVLPKTDLLEEFGGALPDFRLPDEPHAALAAVPFPLYMTTNYDDFMYKALCRAGREPRRDLCRWHRDQAFDKVPPVLDGTFVPEPGRPVVFHLHGWAGVPTSLVLTEDDYLDFLVAVSRDERFLLPHEVHSASSASLLFIGYSLADWNFRVVLRGILSRMERLERRISVTVQLPRDDSEQQAYMEQYFSWVLRLDVRIFWGTASDFAVELRRRWEDYRSRGGGSAAVG